jgi:hypothetical protein
MVGAESERITGKIASIPLGNRLQRQVTSYTNTLFRPQNLI